MPFNWRTPFGYCIAFLMQSAQAYALSLNTVPILAMLIGSCWLLNGICKDIKNDILILNTVKMNTNRQNAIKHFRNAIRDFLTVKQLSIRFLQSHHMLYIDNVFFSGIRNMSFASKRRTI